MSKKVKTDLQLQKEKTELMKLELVERELQARFAKAGYEIMNFSLEAEKLEPAYKEYIERSNEKREAALKAREEFFAGIAKQQEAAGLTDATPDEAVEVTDLETPILSAEVEAQ